MTGNPHKKMGPAPIEGEYLTKQQMIRLDPTLEEAIVNRAGQRSFAAWIRWAARRALGLPERQPEPRADSSEDGGRKDPSEPTAV
jgi:hypothetical protein